MHYRKGLWSYEIPEIQQNVNMTLMIDTHGSAISKEKDKIKKSASSKYAR